MRLHPIRWVVIASFVITSVVYVSVFSPRAIVFSYAGDNCVSQLSLFPTTLHIASNDQYKVTLKDEVSIGNFPIATRSLCVTAKLAPTVDATRINVSPFGWLLAQKTYVITADDRPKVSLAPLQVPIPASKPVKLTLSAPDKVSTYVLATDTAKSTCSSDNKVLSCDMEDLKLEQGTTQKVSLKRYFEGKLMDILVTDDVEVLSAVAVKDTSVKNDQMVYDKPLAFTIELDKPLSSAKATLVQIDGGAEKVIDAKVSVDSVVVTLTPTSEMIRPAKYKISLASAEATDGSGLNEPSSILFNLSDGPQVSSVNIGANTVETNAVVTLTLDQPLRTGQDVAKYVTVTGVPVVVSQVGSRTIRIALQNATRCADFSIMVKKGLVSDHDVANTGDWRFNSRTRCSVISTIGYSVRNRAINAYYFGNGSTTILITGAIHGNESSSKYLTDALIAYLEEHAREIPGDRRVVVVPTVNPDGVAATTRYNAHNVNLNRNFATTNWVSDTEVSGGVIEQGAGGSSSLSEPEAAALAAFTQSLQPRLVVTYHSQGSLINSNDVGIAAILGPQYATMTRYRYISSEATTGTFGFEMTGTYEDWLAERSTPAILVELPTDTGRYFWQHTAAIWAMIRG